MADYTVPTPADLIAAFPNFSGVPEAVIQDRIDEASGRVDQTWTVGDYTRAIMLLACHLLTIDGFGTGVQAQVAQLGALGFQGIKSGTFSMSGPRLSNKASSPGTAAAEYFTTTYGKRFLTLLALNSPGVVVV